MNLTDIFLIKSLEEKLKAREVSFVKSKQKFNLELGPDCWEFMKKYKGYKEDDRNFKTELAYGIAYTLKDYLNEERFIGKKAFEMAVCD